MKSLILSMGLGLCSLASGADVATWTYVGETDSSCSFQVELYQLEGYPFAKVVETGGAGVYSLAVAEDIPCQERQYEQVGSPASPPTFRTTEHALCQGSLPYWTVTRFLSGVQERCFVVE